jgi:xylan 1,4-beta-xylosidase
VFKRDGWYYLTTAEGGTGYGHAVTMARSRALDGPYEMHPLTHVITSKDAPEAQLQRAGHGQLVETPEGEFYHTHLCSRPLPGIRRSPLGRETAIQKCVWKEDGWLYLEQGGQIPDVDVAAPRGAGEREPLPTTVCHDFDDHKLPLDFQWLRTPDWERLFSLSERPGFLRLFGRESIGSWYEQALVARRQEDIDFRAETELDFQPSTFQQAAGLTHYYNRHKFHFLAVTHDARLGRVLRVMSCPGDWPDGRLIVPLAEPIPLPGGGPVGLAAEVRGAELVFSCRVDGAWVQVGPVLDASVISDEGGRGEHGSFTGAFVGMLAFDTSGSGALADFDWFSYERGPLA